jgi:hypothetical protein
MSTPAEVKEYRPELIPRRGEIIAWTGVLMVGLVWLLLALTNQRVVFVIPALFVILCLSALLISLGNWIDRRTVMRMDEQGIEYKNGLRKVRLAWLEIEEVRVVPSRWGNRVQVSSQRNTFAFHTLGEVRMHGELKGRMGFAMGEEILRQLVLKSGLQIVDRQGEGYYYARQ